MGTGNFNEQSIRIGDVYLMDFGGSGCEQCGLRPGLVFQNNIGNGFSPNIIALPLTSSIKKLGQPTHVLVKSEDSGLKLDSIVLCENPERMSKQKIRQYITTLSDDYMKKVAAASLIATSAISFLDIETLKSVWEKTVLLNS